MADIPTAQVLPADEVEALPLSAIGRGDSSVSLRALWRILVRRRRLFLGIEGGLLLFCLLFCLIAPKQYEAVAKVELRTGPASAVSLPSSESAGSLLSASTALETVAGVLRSDELAWRVIFGLKLYQAPGFCGNFGRRFSGFRPNAPSPEAQDWLLKRFAWRLDVETMPRTFLIRIRFRSRDPALSAAVVNALILDYGEKESESQVQATVQASGWLQQQLGELKSRVDEDERRLVEFQTAHGIVGSPEILPNGQPGESQHNTVAIEIDELSRQLVTATGDRILAEAEYRAATRSDPELVIAADPRLQALGSNFSTAVLQQIRARSSDLHQEQAQLSAEHGPSFPRVVEIGRQLDDLDRQKRAEDAKLLERFRAAWQTALDREQLVRKSLDEATAEGLKQNRAAAEYTIMRQEANSSHEVYLRVMEKVEEAGLAAGAQGSSILVVDAARRPAKPVAPDLPLYLAITFFAGLWLALGGVLVSESLGAPAARMIVVLVAFAATSLTIQAQAPTPSTSGLPTGVASFPQTPEARSLPNPKEAPAVWNSAPGDTMGALPPIPAAAAPMPVPIGPGFLLDVSEAHAPEFRSLARVSSAGTVTLPMAGEVPVGGMDELAAARAIEAVLAAKGMLLHPLVSVLVTSYAGQEVSVLGEVARPGVYPYTYHHRLLDLISAASGLSSNAGRLVNVFHANDPKMPHPVVLDPSGIDIASDHNPELSPGDTVQVSRAGLVYVVGDVIRPGGFSVDPVQGLTVVQALSLAWGPSLNAATHKAVLIREQKGGRTLTSLNLRRMLRGQDPDQPVQDRDIIYVPNSVAKNLWNRTMESAIQSTIGVGIYSGLVYSQRY